MGTHIVRMTMFSPPCIIPQTALINPGLSPAGAGILPATTNPPAIQIPPAVQMAAGAIVEPPPNHSLALSGALGPALEVSALRFEADARANEILKRWPATKPEAAPVRNVDGMFSSGRAVFRSHEAASPRNDDPQAGFLDVTWLAALIGLLGAALVLSIEVHRNAVRTMLDTIIDAHRDDAKPVADAFMRFIGTNPPGLMRLARWDVRSRIKRVAAGDEKAIAELENLAFRCPEIFERKEILALIEAGRRKAGAASPLRFLAMKDPALFERKDIHRLAAINGTDYEAASVVGVLVDTRPGIFGPREVSAMANADMAHELQLLAAAREDLSPQIYDELVEAAKVSDNTENALRVFEGTWGDDD